MSGNFGGGGQRCLASMDRTLKGEKRSEQANTRQITPNKKRYARTKEQEQQKQPVNGEAKGVLEKVKGGAADHLHRDSHRGNPTALKFKNEPNAARLKEEIQRHAWRHLETSKRQQCKQQKTQKGETKAE